MWAWLSLDGREWAGELYGWAANPNGADDGWRGLVVAPREFARGFWAEFLGWVRAEQIRQRDCAQKADTEKIIPRDRTAFLIHCLESAEAK